MKQLTLIFAAALIGFIGFSFKEKREFPTINNTEKAFKLPTIHNKAFKRGEKLSFKLHYGLIDAAHATLTVTDEAVKFGGRETFHVVGVGSTRGVSDWFFKVRDRYETYIDEKALVPWMFVRRVDEGGYIINQDYVFNRFEQKVRTEKNKTFDITENMQDMISAFYQARTLDFSNIKEGDMFSIECFVDEEVFPIKIKFKGYETVETDLGKFRCLKFNPLIQTGRIFKHEEDLSFFISDDNNRILIKAKADILFGSIQIELTDYKGLANPIAKI